MHAFYSTAGASFVSCGQDTSVEAPAPSRSAKSFANMCEANKTGEGSNFVQFCSVDYDQGAIEDGLQLLRNRGYDADVSFVGLRKRSNPRFDQKVTLKKKT